MLMEGKLEIMLLLRSEEGSVAKWFFILPTYDSNSHFIIITFMPRAAQLYQLYRQ